MIGLLIFTQQESKKLAGRSDTGETVPLFREKDPILFDASSEDTCTWGTGEVARRSHLHAGSRYVLGDRLKIECAIAVCGDFLTFDDPPPTPSSGLPLFQQVGYGKGEPDVIIQVEGGTIGAHYCILNAHCT
ncbi:Speckle-type POZ protein-like protein [Hordeum vulgare]|nr:Speckle-type POZ protein-like protein [Hordeum vulgare]